MQICKLETSVEIIKSGKLYMHGCRLTKFGLSKELHATLNIQYSVLSSFSTVGTCRWVRSFESPGFTSGLDYYLNSSSGSVRNQPGLKCEMPQYTNYTNGAHVQVNYMGVFKKNNDLF